MSALKFVLCAAITVCGGAQAQTIGIHAVSAHIPQHQQSNMNPGAYLRTASGVELGFYRNSWRRPSVYASQQFDLVSGNYGEMGLQIGVATGYQRRCDPDCSGFSRGAITPLAGLTYTAPAVVTGIRPRVQFLPPIGKHAAVIHLTLERWIWTQ